MHVSGASISMHFKDCLRAYGAPLIHTFAKLLFGTKVVKSQITKKRKHRLSRQNRASLSAYISTNKYLIRITYIYINRQWIKLYLRICILFYIEAYS